MTLKEVLSIKDIVPDSNGNWKSILAQHLKEDSLFYKKLLREIFLIRIKDKLGSDLNRDTSLAMAVPRKRRPMLFYELGVALNADLPKLTLSNYRLIVHILVFILPGILYFLLVDNNHAMLGHVLTGLFLSSVSSYGLFMMIVLFFPTFFAALDWPALKTIDDLLFELSIINSEAYSENDFSLTITSVEELLARSSFPPESPARSSSAAPTHP